MLTYAVNNLHVSHVIVVGHTRCGGVEAAQKAAAQPPSPPDGPLARWIAPIVDIAREHPDADLTTLVEENVKAGVRKLVENEVIRGAWAQRRNVKVHGWVYELETERLRDLEVSVGKEDCLE